MALVSRSRAFGFYFRQKALIKTKRDSLSPRFFSLFSLSLFFTARGGASERPFNSSPCRSTRPLFPPTFPPGASPGTGHHHNSVFSRARGIQSAVESTSPKSDGTTSSSRAGHGRGALRESAVIAN